MVRKRYYENGGLNLAWDLGVIFLAIPNFANFEFWKHFFFNIGLKGVIEKCVGCFLLYLFLRGFFDKKGVTKQGCVCVCDSFKNALLPLKTSLLLWKGVIENLGYRIKNVKFTEYLF